MGLRHRPGGGLKPPSKDSDGSGDAGFRQLSASAGLPWTGAHPECKQWRHAPCGRGHQRRVARLRPERDAPRELPGIRDPAPRPRDRRAGLATGHEDLRSSPIRVSVRAARCRLSTIRSRAFQWADYGVLPGRKYTYRVYALSGTGPLDMVKGPPIQATITTEPEAGKIHSIYFNRGSVASQAYARDFRNTPPSAFTNPAQRGGGVQVPLPRSRGGTAGVHCSGGRAGVRAARRDVRVQVAVGARRLRNRCTGEGQGHGALRRHPGRHQARSQEPRGDQYGRDRRSGHGPGPAAPSCTTSSSCCPGTVFPKRCGPARPTSPSKASSGISTSVMPSTIRPSPSSTATTGTWSSRTSPTHLTRRPLPPWRCGRHRHHSLSFNRSRRPSPHNRQQRRSTGTPSSPGRRRRRRS